MFQYRFIQGPDPKTVDVLSRRTNPEVREQIRAMRPGAIALIQTSLPDLYYYTDLAVKAADVFLAEITGNCPQHVSTIGLFGDSESVRQALKRIIEMAKRGDSIEI